MWPNVKTGKVLLGSLLALATSHYSMEAQTDQKYLPADSTSDTVSAVAPSENKTKSSLFYYLVPESGVKKGIGCEFRTDLAGLPLQIFMVTLTSLLVRLRSGCVDRLEVWKSPLATGV